MTDLVVRPLEAGEEALFTSLPDRGLVGRALLGKDYHEADYQSGRTWVALRDDVVVARAAWWSGPDDEEPIALDWFDFTDLDAAVHLLTTAPFRVEYSLTTPPAWEDDPDVAHEVNVRIEAAEKAGYRKLVERYRYSWTPANGLPERPGRLEFRPEPDDDVILDVFRKVNADSLDAHVRRTVAEHGVEAAAQEDLDIMRWMPAPREWWRLAYTREGDLVGFALPSRNYYDPVIGYIAVVPEQRGHGYAYDLLAEATHDLVGYGADRIVAATDVPNVPMAKAFAKAGYPVTQHRIDLV
ncbi:GNAT family N-acetyltransferase [Amycolatopsis sp., V23-08]|uniref:GNAT family N-acetyltransferase n=1 Tax=Amycolatopsis heterodermiae TaxID=3110235 RepID=A0ABU5QYU4_9PSEU|nr:GNAT family N-acetyltransferase [Amycolatopsis sp., V23-08]MEA5359115.1 GNAT family N-acetyltransferase [Amycolatopsis sp., V23-08]